MRSYSPSKGSAAAGRPAARSGRAVDGGASVRPQVSQLEGRILERLIDETTFRNLSTLDQIIERSRSPWVMTPGQAVVASALRNLLRRLFPILNALELAMMLGEWARRQGGGKLPGGPSTGIPPGHAYHVPVGYSKIWDFSDVHIPHTGHNHQAEFALAWSANPLGEPTNGSLTFPVRGLFPDTPWAVMWRSTRANSNNDLLDLIVNWEEWQQTAGGQGNWKKAFVFPPQF